MNFKQGAKQEKNGNINIFMRDIFAFVSFLFFANVHFSLTLVKIKKELLETAARDGEEEIKVF
jgi:hypothetical protein